MGKRWKVCESLILPFEYTGRGQKVVGGGPSSGQSHDRRTPVPPIIILEDEWLTDDTRFINVQIKV